MKKDELKIYLQIQKMQRALRDEIKKKWDRVLSFNETLSDRWEKAKYLGFAEGASIYDSSLVFGNVEVGKKTWIGPFTILDGKGGLKIGSYCSISSGVQIYTHDSVKWALSGGRAKYEYASTKIGDFCYLGPNVIISKGVTIGNHCLIGANALVNKDIADYSIVFGTPGKIIGKVIVNKKGEIELDYNKGT